MNESRYSRQSFLGPDSEADIAACTVGIVGLGGGGSHVVQQLAHLGFQNYVLYDDEHVEKTNLNRLVGATLADTKSDGQPGTAKLDVAIRTIRGLQPDASIIAVPSRWQVNPLALRECHVVFGGVDSYLGRHELEVACRRYLIHYIDIGMDVHGTTLPVIGGQIILSSPEGPCMKCIQFLTEEKLAREGTNYGAAGGKPQVVWANGVLASSAVGLCIELVTGWSQKRRSHAYLVYDGNTGLVNESLTLLRLDPFCRQHHPIESCGDPVLIEL
jgi:hypothetical protein